MEPSDNFIFPYGKHVGKSYALVKKIDYQYIVWALEKAPKIFKKSEPKEPVSTQPAPRKEVPEDSEVTQSSMQPNLDFLKQVGDSHFKKEEIDGDKS